MSDKIDIVKFESIKSRLQEAAQPYRELMSCYKCAMMEVETKFRVLDEELSLEYDRNPIESIKTRLKSHESIIDKLYTRNIQPIPENIESQIYDIAGVRVICTFPSDIYMLSKAFLGQDDVKLVEIKDYIKNPKPSGYRSLHLIVEVPIFLHDEKKFVKVEVQLRTMSMDWWASQEHKIKYKKNVSLSPEAENELRQCAEIAAELDLKMEKIAKNI
ncbi:MAG: GTP pyrophosphokinase family protein [Ruminococcaceae bacterium]|nr:GTP pyrophosphokinase family protein [Oscillospiraceae bacterium]